MSKSKVARFMSSEDPAKVIKEQQKLIERQQKQIENFRRARVPKSRPAKSGSAKGGFVRMFFGDSHGAHQDEKAVAAVLRDIAVIRPKEIVHVGDALDCNGFLTEHSVLGVVPELDVTFEDDQLAANGFLDAIQKAAPDAKMTLIEGNHEHRLKRWACKVALTNRRNADYLLRALSPDVVLNAEKRGIRYIHRDRYYDGLNVSGTAVVDPWAIAQHGEGFSGEYAAFHALRRNKKSTFFGHNHRLGVAYGEGVDARLVACNTGCLCKIRPVYGLTVVTGWLHGYILQFVHPKSGFLAFPVPIVNGKSYLDPFARLLG